jgi:hypothetical protein
METEFFVIIKLSVIMRNTCSLVIVISVTMMIGLVVSDPPTPYPYYDHHDESTNSPTPFPYNSQSPNLVAKGRKKSPPPPPSKLPPPPPPVVHFDFFKLVERWPKTFCFTKTCRTDIQQKFVIHGLWPTIKAPSGSQPEDCEEVKGVNFYMVTLFCSFHWLFIIIIFI